MNILSMDLQKRPSEHLYALLTWVLLMFVYHVIFGAFFPTPQGTIGDDYGLGLASLVDGFIWFSKNGPWAVPWFSPGFCGGQPFFADPQSGYYSVPQWLTFLTDPLTACYLTLLLFASAGYFGIYFLARRSFGLPIAWAILAAALYFFNGFMPHRMIVGHGGYHGLSLAPWLALALLTPAANRIATIGLGILAGAIAAYWLQSGLTTLMVPATLSIALILLVYRIYQAWPRDLLVRILVASGVTVAISASKLVASLSFYGRFERTQYLLPGFSDPLALLQANLLALFGSSEDAYTVASAYLVNAQWASLPHEWAYSFTLVPFLVLMIVLIIRIAQIGRPEQNKNSVRVAANYTHTFIYLAIFAICLLPLIIQIYTPTLNAIFKRIPLIGATTSPMRWLIIYLPVVPIATVMIARAVLRERTKLVPWVVSGAIALLIISNMLDKREYYHNQTYRPEVLLAGYERLATDRAASHRIQSVGQLIDPDTGKIVNGNNRNDIVVDGISQARCYNPSFGYRLEKLPSGGLIMGDVFTERDGRFNVRNPACYVFTDENECKPGDRFRVDQRPETENFVRYLPFVFKKSLAQHIADVVTMGALLLIIVFLLVVWPLSVLRRWRC